MNPYTYGATSKRGLILSILALTLANGGAAIIALGAADSFAVLAGSTVTNTGATIVSGNLGVSPGTSITGFPPGLVINGTLNSGNAAAAQAHADAAIAYNQLAGLSTTVDLTGQNLGGMTLTPGIYSFDTSAQLTGTLTLNGLGLADPQFIFKIGSTLTTASDAMILLSNGAVASNTFFQVGSSATLGTGTIFEGTIISLASNTLNSGATVNGRVIALNDAVTLSNNVIVVPEISASTMAAIGAALLLVKRRRWTSRS